MHFFRINFRLCLLFLLIPMVSQGKETITWYAYELPPAYITTGPYQGKGTMDWALDEFIANMPEFNHRRARVNITRLKAEMEKGTNNCVLGIFKVPALEKFRHYQDKPILNARSWRIYTTPQNKITLFNNVNHIDFETVFQEMKLRMGTAERMFFHPVINTVVAKYKETPLIRVTSNRAYMEAWFDMLQAKQVDFVVASPTTAGYYSRLKNRPFVSIKINGVPEMVESYGNCSKSELGKQAIQRMNEIMTDDFITKVDNIRNAWAEYAHGQ